MANLTVKSTTNLFSILPRRLASTAAQSKKSEESKKRASLPKESVKVSKLPSGVVVASLENHSPITRIAAVINTGSRDENSKERGASHALRIYSGLATKNYSKFGLSRTLDQIGAEVTVKATREQTTYVLEATRNNTSRAVDIMGEVISRPELRHWEIHDSEPRLTFDLDCYDETPELKLSDMIHSASFRSGLSNTLYAPRYNLHNIDANLLKQFRNRNFTLNRLALVGLGISHDDLIKYAEFFRLPSQADGAARQASKFLGTEIRDENNSQLVHVAIGAEGAGLSAKDYWASNIFSNALGNGPRIKYSSGSNKLAKAVGAVASQPAMAGAFNANYSDAGLFGIHIIGQANDIGKVTKAVHAEISKISKNGLSAQEITNAKNSLKASIALSHESAHSQLESLGQNQDAKSLDDILKSIDSVSANDINAFAKKVATGKKSLAAIGDLASLPRLDEFSE